MSVQQGGLMRRALPFFILLGMLAGCGGEKTPEVANVSVPENIPVNAAVPAAGNGVIRGKVLFSGVVPSPVILDMAADPVCAGAHTEPVYSEDLLVSGGALQNAFVYIKEGLPAGAVYPVPLEPVLLDQNGCRYSPRIFGVRTNQPLTIVNSDSTLHNVHAQPKNSPGYNLGMPLKGMKNTKKFTSPEVMAHFKCDVHPWMSAYAGVMDHPFFAVTGTDGAFELKGLPAGHYTVSVWHEKLGTKDIKAEVTEGQLADIEVIYAA